MSNDHNTPKAMAESMLKRFLQFKRALPADDNAEVFQLILDNRYKLLGNLISASDRKELITTSMNSLSLLTFNTMVAEDASFRSKIANNQSRIQEALKEVHSIIAKEVTKEESFDVLLRNALQRYA